jgi:DNA replication protein DnaC
MKTTTDEFSHNIKDALAKYSVVPLRHIAEFDDIYESDALNEALKYDYHDFLVLCGPPGTGKSFIAAYLCYRWALDAYDRHFKNGADWDKVTAQLREQIIWYTAYELAASTCQEQWDIASKYRVLVIDDLGMEDNSPSSVAAINFMVAKRYDHGENMATVITCNMTIDGITERYGRRLTNRLIENGRIVVCDRSVARKSIKAGR